MGYQTLSIEMEGGIWLTFTLPTVKGVGASYPLLTEIGTLRSTARAAHLEGIGSTEAPSISVTLNNEKRRASGLIGLPLRRRARIQDASGVLFEGVIQSVKFGTALTLEIAA